MDTTTFLEMNVFWELYSSLCTMLLCIVLPHQKGKRELLGLPWLQRDSGSLWSAGNQPRHFANAVIPQLSWEKKKREAEVHSGGRELEQRLFVKFYLIKGTKRGATRTNRAIKPILCHCLLRAKHFLNWDHVEYYSFQTSVLRIWKYIYFNW